MQRAALSLSLLLAGSTAMAAKEKADIKVTWLGHAAFEVVSPGGTTLLLDPFLKDNPTTPADRKDLSKYKPTAILVTHSHPDHLGDARELLASGGFWLSLKIIVESIGRSIGNVSASAYTLAAVSALLAYFALAWYYRIALLHLNRQKEISWPFIASGAPSCCSPWPPWRWRSLCCRRKSSAAMPTIRTCLARPRRRSPAGCATPRVSWRC